MKITLHYRTFLLATVLAGSVLFGSCKKEKVPVVEPNELTKWDIISGQYKVYDTLGVFLYDLTIIHKKNEALNHDSLKFVNFNNEFTFSEKQSTFSSNPEFYLKIGYHDTLYDSFQKRWKIFTALDSIYNNVLLNDTIKLNFQKTNINYYIEDLVPYYSCNCKQIAVKQH